MDITERKLAEQALRESERRERDAAERLRTLDEMKNTFLAAVSHELRSPLTSILGLSLTLERAPELDERRPHRPPGAARHERPEARPAVEGPARHRPPQPRHRRAAVPDPGPRRARQDHRRSARRARRPGGRAATSSQPSHGRPSEAGAHRGEPRHEHRSPHPARIVTIWVRVSPTDGGATVIVEDDGPGVPPDLREAIFEPFRQGPTASPHSPGTGIGLSLVARFAELHGGRAWVEDRAGGGASFRVFLPSGPEREHRLERTERLPRRCPPTPAPDLAVVRVVGIVVGEALAERADQTLPSLTSLPALASVLLLGFIGIDLAREVGLDHVVSVERARDQGLHDRGHRAAPGRPPSDRRCSRRRSRTRTRRPGAAPSSWP